MTFVISGNPGSDTNNWHVFQCRVFFSDIDLHPGPGCLKVFFLLHCSALGKRQSQLPGQAHSLSLATEARSQNLYSSHKLKLNRKQPVAVIPTVMVTLTWPPHPRRCPPGQCPPPPRSSPRTQRAPSVPHSPPGVMSYYQKNI